MKDRLAQISERVAKGISASVSSIVLEVPVPNDKTIVEFTEQGVKVLKKGSAHGYLHFPLIEKVIRDRVRAAITIRRFDRGDRYKEDSRVGCSAEVSSTEEMWDGHSIESSYGKRGDGSTGVSKSSPLPPHPNKAKKVMEYDKAVLLTLDDGRSRTIDWSYDKEVLDYEDGSAPSSPTPELRRDMAELSKKSLPEIEEIVLGERQRHVTKENRIGRIAMNKVAVASELVKLAKSLVSRADMEQRLNKKIYLNAGQKYWVVSPKGFSWRGDSPIDFSIYKSPSNGACVLELEPTLQEKMKWSVQEFSSLDQAKREVDRDYEAGL